MKKKIFWGLAIGFLLFGMVGFANATLTVGDFRAESNAPEEDFLNPGVFGLPKVYEHLGATIDGLVELSAADFLENPDGWEGGLVTMDFNPGNNILTFEAQDDWDFQTFEAWINNIVFDRPEEIAGITMLTNSITDPTIIPTFSFTANSLHFRWDAGWEQGNYFDFIEGGTATFQITTVPEPSTMLLLGFGLVGLAGLAGKKMKK